MPNPHRQHASMSGARDPCRTQHLLSRTTPTSAHNRPAVALWDDVLRCCTHRSGGERPVELLKPARLVSFRRPGGVCHPFAFSEQKGATMSMVRMIVGGVDTHADTHVGAVVDTNGGVLGIEAFPADESGYEALVGWLTSHGEISMVGVEGTGSWGVGLSRFLHSHGIVVVEVDRPNRQNRRRVGKSDPTDAVSAARAALSGSASVTPKTRNGPVEQMRILMVARRSARSQRIETLNQLRHLVFTGPEEIRSRFKDRYKTGLMAVGERQDGPIFIVDAGQRMDRHQAARIVARLARRAGIDKRISPAFVAPQLHHRGPRRWGPTA